ncbi:hypothetical protein [Ponticoccus litoralis]|uniref:Uncharacterized protein n=1 Tax=Ponticoccus litoralis TaxID=422297 RepID=A0AAW9SNF7_9RHOB
MPKVTSVPVGLTEAGKLTAALVMARQKSGVAELLKQVAKRMAAEAAVKKAVEEAEEALTVATLAKYPELTAEEIRPWWWMTNG